MQAKHNRRLAKAARGEWGELLREYIADLLTSEHEQPADQRTLERAARRAREGSVVAAAAALIGGPRVTPSRAVTEQIKSQFITSIAASASEDVRHTMNRIKGRGKTDLVITRTLT